MLNRRTLLAAAAAVPVTAGSRRARAQSKVVRLGVLNDQSGPYRDIGGMQSVNAVRQAVAEFGGGMQIEVLFADHQNKPDVGAGIARQWYDQDGVSIILDVPTSSVALAVNNVAREKNRILLDCGAATSDLTGSQCTPSTIHWSYDTYMLARSTGGAMVKAGGDSWYFVTADYVFGQQLQRDATIFVKAAGGKVAGASPYPFPGTSDFSSFLLSAQSSGAKVLGLANSGADTINSIKQAAEFGLTSTMKIAALLMYINDVHGLGLEQAQGLNLTESFYWDMNDGTRAFTKGFQARMPNIAPNMNNAGSYAGALHFLKAVRALGGPAAALDGAAVVAQMKAMPTEDDAFGKASIRSDGMALVPSYLFQVKTPAESKYPWDYYKLVVATPADQAWKPLAEGGCPLIRS
jgi:branched-chain amino acid transport system substrate-binding protein